MSREIQVTLNKLHKAQQQIISEKKRFNVVICGRRWGKSTMAENLLVEPALAGNPVGYFTPTYKLLEPTFKQIAFRLKDITKRKHDNQFIELITGGIIEFWSLENELAGRSRKYKRAILDECAFVKNLKSSWNESIRATLTDLKGDAWFMSTPKGKNDLHTFFCRGFEDDKWKSWQMPTSTNPYIDPLEIEDAKQDMPEMAFRQEYLAEFLEDGAGVFMKLLTLDTESGSKFFAGLDLGRADDYTVLTIQNEKGNVVVCERWRHDTWGNIVKNVMHYLNKFKPRLLVEVNSIGDVIYEQIKAQYNQAYPFVTTSKSKQDIVEGLQVSIQNGEFTIPNHEWLKREFEVFTYEYSPKTRTIKYSAPQGMHDDGVMSCCLSNECFKEWKTKGTFNYMVRGM